MDRSVDRHQRGRKGRAQRLTVILGVCALLVSLAGLLSYRLLEGDAARSVAPDYSASTEPGARGGSAIDTSLSTLGATAFTWQYRDALETEAASGQGAVGDSVDEDQASATALLEDTNPDSSAEDATKPGDGSEEAQDDAPPTEPISGWVFDEQREPLQGIQVVARLKFLSDPSTSARGPKSTSTDAEGGFEFTDLPAGEYELVTKASSEYAAARQVVRSGSRSVLLVARAAQPRPVEIEGVVSIRDGSLVQGVRVSAARQRASAATDQYGAYRLRASVRNGDSLTVRFSHEEYRTKQLTLSTSELKERDRLQLDAQLEPLERRVSVVGLVTAADGTPIPRATTRLYSSSLRASYSAVSDADGEFALNDVQTANDYRLWVKPKERFREHLEEGIAIKSDPTQLPVVLEPQEYGSLSGQMVDAFGQPVPFFSLWHQTSSGTLPGGSLVTGDAQGSFYLEQVPSGEHSLATRSLPQILVTGLRVEEGEQAQVRVTLDWGEHTLAGYVVDGTNEPVAGAELQLRWLYEENGIQSRSTRSSSSDASGYFLFTRLGPGGRVLTMSAPGYRDEQIAVTPSLSGDEISLHLDRGSL